MNIKSLPSECTDNSTVWFLPVVHLDDRHTHDNLIHHVNPFICSSCCVDSKEHGLGVAFSQMQKYAPY